ncbi:hypothetical protein BWD42_23950 [Sphingobacterium sp. CZ-UAM]|uniref:hypothetical protein n=1 Tax=Sphingobacterium sp. CZ-UAM TaxID=1933868 RepID=UPI000984B9B6|nr:hypothetical protein [Sphingobacterium sp. CZ-UAM]OOG15737.1 hypothetical protein BWD42_23950 [Sphingobacterium sp. CZ-UAM]
MAWFSFTGTNPSNPTHYSAPSSTPPSCTSPTEQMCALQANDNGSNQPVITDALKNEIINSLQNQVDGPNVRLKTR